MSKTRTLSLFYGQVKNCISTFEEIASRPNVRFLGNVAVGYDVTVEELLRKYHVVVLAYGAGSGGESVSKFIIV